LVAEARRSCCAYFASRAGRVDASCGAAGSAAPVVRCIERGETAGAVAALGGKASALSASNSSSSCGRLICPDHTDGFRLSALVDTEDFAGTAGKSSSAIGSAGELVTVAGLCAGATIADVTSGAPTIAAEGGAACALVASAVSA
jgi:hypothetical protein